MLLFLDRLDAAPVNNDDFSFQFSSWFSVLVDNYNETINDIENQFNGISNWNVISFHTMAEIAVLAATAPDGVMFYATDHVPPVYVGKISGALVQFTTTPYP
jgi:hypothetical protein